MIPREVLSFLRKRGEQTVIRVFALPVPVDAEDAIAKLLQVTAQDVPSVGIVPSLGGGGGLDADADVGL